MFKNLLSKIILTFILSFFSTLFFLYAWTEPVTNPPGGNVAAPINVSNSPQYKAGSLGVGGPFVAYSTAIFKGSVGIGTTTPKVKLHVDQGDAIFEDDVAIGGRLITYSTAIFMKGPVGIGAMPKGKLHVAQGNAIFEDNVVIGTTTPQGKLYVSQGNAIFDGNVGIGTINPTEKLYVNGGIKATGDICAYAGGSNSKCLSRVGEPSEQAFYSWFVNHCKICFSWEADDTGTGQCNSNPEPGTQTGAGTVCAPINNWTTKYRDDTDDRRGGCRMSWGIFCQ